MLDWLKNINKEYPEFWKNYVAKFEKKSNRFVVLSTETSGLNPDKDIILSIGSFAVIDNSIVIGDNFETVLLQYKFLHDNGLSNEFIVESKMKKLVEKDKKVRKDIKKFEKKLKDYFNLFNSNYSKYKTCHFNTFVSKKNILKFSMRKYLTFRETTLRWNERSS